MDDAPLNASRPSVFLLVTQMEIGGAQKVSISLAGRLDRAGYPTRLCFLYDKAGLVTGLRAEHDFPIEDLRARRSGGRALAPLRVAGACLALWRRLRTTRPEVILTFTPYSNILGCTLAWLAGVPRRIASQRTVPFNYARLLWRTEGWLARRGVIQQVVAVSEAVRQFCVEKQRVPIDQLRVIRNGVEVERFAGLREQRAANRARLDLEDRFVILSIARLVPAKGIADLILAVQQLKERVDRPILVVLGGGPQRAELERQIAAAKLEASVRLEGEVADPRPYLAAADAFALASTREGLPNALLEAMAAGLPIVATRVGGVPEAIEDGLSGLLVQPGDPHAMAEAIHRLWRQPELRQQLGASASRRAAERFSAEAFLREFRAVLDEVPSGSVAGAFAGERGRG
jgi:glycosyltransferase involved in cell wall biosynthesis